VKKSTGSYLFALEDIFFFIDILKSKKVVSKHFELAVNRMRIEIIHKQKNTTPFLS